MPFNAVILRPHAEGPHLHRWRAFSHGVLRSLRSLRMTARLPSSRRRCTSRPMPNRLAGEASPYLQQHAGNPVDWYPWGPEVLEKAKKEDKPILLSIGYSACH